MIQKIIDFLLALFKEIQAQVREDANGNPVTIKPPPPEDKPDLVDTSYKKDLLYYSKATFQADPTAASSKLLNPQFVIYHHSVSYELQSTVDYMKKANVSAHYIVGKDGKVIQMLPNNVKGWHAGKSTYNGLSDLNNISIGIEFVNIGPLTKKGDKFFDYYNREYKGAVHIRKGLGYEFWEAITPAQEKAALELSKYLMDVLQIKPENHLGHYEVSPGRKNDPYGLFTFGDMDAYRKKLNTI